MVAEEGTEGVEEWEEDVGVCCCRGVDEGGEEVWD